MALKLADRVQETTSTSGTGTLNLAGAVTGYQSFVTGIGSGNQTYYCIYDNTAGVWEVGTGTVTAGTPNTLSRTTIYSNSSGTTLPISLAGNPSSVFCVYTASKTVNLDINNNANILTYVPNTATTTGTLNVGDGTYNFSQSGQIATFAAADNVVNGINVQNTSSSNTAYSSVQVGANNYNTGYFLEIGTNSSTYNYSAAGYPNNNANQPNANYIESNMADLSIITWNANNIHFIQNASVSTTDSMTLFYSGGVSLGGNPDPGLGTLYANNVYLGFNSTIASGTTLVLTNSSLAYQRVVGTTNQTIKLPDATTMYQGIAFTIDNDATGTINIVDNASAMVDTVVSGAVDILVLVDNSTVAGTWVAYSYLPSSYDFNYASANFGGAVISNTTYQGNPVQSGYGGTGLNTFSGANNALYSTGASTLTAGTLPVLAGGTGRTTFTSNGVLVGNGTSGLNVTTAPSSANTFLQWTGTNFVWGAPQSQDPALPFYFTFEGPITTTSYGYAVADGVYINQLLTVAPSDTWFVGVEGEIYVTETATPTTTYTQLITTNNTYTSDVRFFSYVEIDPYATVTLSGANMEICGF